MWSPDYLGELKLRHKTATRTISDFVLRRAIMQTCRGDPLRWIESYAITYDPRRKGDKTLPFLLFPRQKEFVRFLQGCVLDKENGLVEKCRDAGMTWLCCAFAVWMWLFVPGSSIGFGSSKELKLDRMGDPDSIFEKIRTIIRTLPAWMMPAGFDPKVHLNYMKIVNPANGASITGEAGDNIGRGGRKTIYFKDESAHYEHPELIEAALGDTTEVQIDISSVNGSANVFYRRRMAGEVWEPDKAMTRGRVRVFLFDWRDDPRKDQEWYAMRRQKAELEGLLHIFAQEVDRDYTGSVEGIIIPQEWVRSSLNAREVLADRKFGQAMTPEKQAYLDSWEEGEHTAAQDVADGGLDRHAYASRHGVVLKRTQVWGGEANEAARTGIPLAIEDGIHEFYYDSIGVGAGFKSEANTMIREGVVSRSLRIMPWNAAAAPLDPEENVILGDDQSPTNEDLYSNLKVQSWFRMRQRFWKVHLAVTQDKDFPIAEMISIPANLPGVQELCMEFSQAVKKTATNGKTAVDKKPDGSLSPNRADSANMCYCPTREISIFDVL